MIIQALKSEQQPRISSIFIYFVSYLLRKVAIYKIELIFPRLLDLSIDKVGNTVITFQLSRLYESNGMYLSEASHERNLGCYAEWRCPLLFEHGTFCPYQTSIKIPYVQSFRNIFLTEEPTQFSDSCDAPACTFYLVNSQGRHCGRHSSPNFPFCHFHQNKERVARVLSI